MQLKDLKIKDNVLFGSFSADGESAAPIEWVKASETIYIASKSQVQMVPYKSGQLRYRDSSVRVFLNSRDDGNFLRSFSDWEIGKMMRMDVVVGVPSYARRTTRDTKDVLCDLVTVPSIHDIVGKTFHGIAETTGDLSGTYEGEISGSITNRFFLRTPRTEAPNNNIIFISCARYSGWSGYTLDSALNRQTGILPMISIDPETYVDEVRDEFVCVETKPKQIDYEADLSGILKI